MLRGLCWAGILFAARMALAHEAAADTPPASTALVISGPRHARILHVGSGGSVDARSIHLAADGGGNTLVAASFSGTIDLGGPAPIASRGKGKNTFVAAYDEAGQLLWQQRLGGAGDDWISGLAVGGGGTIYLGGALHPETAADLGGVPPPCGAPVANVVAMDPSGRPRWATQARTGEATAFIGPIAANAQDEVILIGKCETCAAIELGGKLFHADANAFVAKIAPDGSTSYLRALHAADGDFNGIAAMPDGAVLLSLAAKHVHVGDVIVHSARGWDGFMVRLEPSRDLGWIRRFGGWEDDRADQVVVDGNGQAFLTGCVGQKTLLGGGYLGAGCFWATLAADGRLDRVHAIAADSFRLAVGGRDVVIAGTSTHARIVGASPAEERKTEAFVAWVAANGDERLVRHLVGEGEIHVQDLAVDARGQAVIAGTFTDTLRLGGTSILDAGGDRAVFLAAFGP